MVDVPADTIRIQANTESEGVQERLEGGAVTEAIDNASTIAAAGETPLLEAIESEHPDVSVWQAGPEPVVPERHVADSAWYLIDPSGWVMMRYASEVNYKDVIGDLKFLLKNSGG